MRIPARQITVIVLSVLILVALPGAMPVHAQNPPSAQVMLLSYYNAINTRNYLLAYGLWVSPSQSYQDFAAGFADTDRVAPYFGDLELGNVSTGESGRVPTVLFGYHTDGKIVSYHGCLALTFNAPNTTGWRILNADFQLISDQFVPSSQAIEQYLGIDCYGPTSAITVDAVPPHSETDLRALNTLNTYYGLINRRDYATAYAMWLKPLPGPKPNGMPAQDYRLPYNDFVAGYTDTLFIDVYPGSYTETGGSAGHGYLDGVLPAVLVGQHTDGSVVSYYGCYVMGWLDRDKLGIVSGTFLPLTQGDVPGGKAILESLKTDCFSLELSL
jgi:hypothetical protein